MAAAVQRKQRLSDNEATTSSKIDGVTQQPASQDPANGHSASAGAAKAAVAAAAKRSHKQPLFKRLNQRINRIRSWLWSLIEDLFEEFQPWLKWIIFDAVLTLIVGQLVKHVEAVRPLFEAVGWA